MASHRPAPLLDSEAAEALLMLRGEQVDSNPRALSELPQPLKDNNDPKSDLADFDACPPIPEGNKRTKKRKLMVDNDERPFSRPALCLEIVNYDEFDLDDLDVCPPVQYVCKRTDRSVQSSSLDLPLTGPVSVTPSSFKTHLPLVTAHGEPAIILRRCDSRGSLVMYQVQIGSEVIEVDFSETNAYVSPLELETSGHAQRETQEKASLTSKPNKKKTTLGRRIAKPIAAFPEGSTRMTRAQSKAQKENTSAALSLQQVTTAVSDSPTPDHTDQDGDTIMNDHEATVAGQTAAESVGADTTTPVPSTRNNVMTTSGAPANALDMDDHFQRNQPRPLGVLLPENAAHTEHEWVAYKNSANFDWSDSTKIFALNRWRQQRIRRKLNSLGQKVDGRKKQR